MSDYRYVPLLCHKCGTIIEACANGYHLQYHHNEKTIVVKGREVQCTICEGKQLSFIEYLEDKEILDIDNYVVFERVAEKANKHHLLKQRYVEA